MQIAYLLFLHEFEYLFLCINVYPLLPIVLLIIRVHEAMQVKKDFIQSLVYVVHV